MNWNLFVFLLIILIVNAKVPGDEVTNDSNNLNRKTRDLKPIYGFFQTIGNMKRIITEQYTDSRDSLQGLLDLFNDSFSDTATKKPSTNTAKKMMTGENITTTTEMYRVSRKELGRIINRNYRGLQKLLRIELADAFSQSKNTIIDYEKYKWNKKRN